jgi:D-glycero-beta-D-manno-heptose 1-phosphate adenylyltransferase
MNFREKIIPIENLAAWRTQIRKQGKGLVVTNGCFDLLHLGHVTYLQDARNQGDMLLVGLTSDAEVHRLKGPARPLNTEQDRAAVLAALQSVDIYVKGGDYTIDTINQDERRFLEKRGTKIIILPGVPGKSTTGLLEKIAKL